VNCSGSACSKCVQIVRKTTICGLWSVSQSVRVRRVWSLCGRPRRFFHKVDRHAHPVRGGNVQQYTLQGGGGCKSGVWTVGALARAHAHNRCHKRGGSTQSVPPVPTTVVQSVDWPETAPYFRYLTKTKPNPVSARRFHVYILHRK